MQDESKRNQGWKHDMEYGERLYQTRMMTLCIVALGKPQIGPRSFYQTSGKRNRISHKHTHTHKINLLLTPLLTLPGRVVQTLGEGLQFSNPGGITRLWSSKMTPGLSSILHLTGEHISLYISDNTKKLQNFSKWDIILLSSAYNNPSFFWEGKCIATSLKSLVNVFRKKLLGCPLLLYHFGLDALGRGIGSQETMWFCPGPA